MIIYGEECNVTSCNSNSVHALNVQSIRSKWMILNEVDGKICPRIQNKGLIKVKSNLPVLLKYFARFAKNCMELFLQLISLLSH